MSSLRHHITRVLIAAALGFGGCVGGTAPATERAERAAAARAPAGGSAAPAWRPTDPLLPARVRRLTNAEYAASVFALLGVDADAAVAGFPRDATQKLGFTVNDAQIVSSVLASQLDSIAQQIVTSARQIGQFDFLAPCSDPTSGRRDLRAHLHPVVRRQGLPASRSPPTTSIRCWRLYRAGAAEGGTYDDGHRLRHPGDPAGAELHLPDRAGRQHRRQPGGQDQLDAVRDRQPALVPGDRDSARPGAARQRRRRWPPPTAASSSCGASADHGGGARGWCAWCASGWGSTASPRSTRTATSTRRSRPPRRHGGRVDQLHRRGATRRRRHAAGAAGRGVDDHRRDNGATDDEISAYYTGYLRARVDRADATVASARPAPRAAPAWGS